MGPGPVAPSSQAAATEIQAVVVTYNPGPDLGRNLAALRAQFARVLVVDNGSTDAAAVRQLALQAGCAVQCNPSNLGIATALNQGVAALLAGPCRWLAMFDQDSLLPEGAVRGLLATLAAYPGRDAVGILATAHRDRGTVADYHHAVDILEEAPRWRLLRTTITSGSMVRREVLERLGGFEDALFIDSVDHEFCLRMRRAGFSILEAKEQVMAHSVGAVTAHTLLGLRFVCTNHSPLRRYYMVRNQLEVCRRYLLFDPRWASKSLLQVASGALRAVLFETHKLAKARAVMAGIAHFALRRFGQRAQAR